jgi:hypothetical protein
MAAIWDGGGANQKKKYLKAQYINISLKAVEAISESLA